VEEARSEDLFGDPLHPYTQALLSSSPSIDIDHPRKRVRLQGDLPSPIDPPEGCLFHTRCTKAKPVCEKYRPKLREINSGHKVACIQYENADFYNI
jgi:oligopeptide/dipeptide ABC transporter ATP-binding protein